ncbi:hypothetical protein BV898_12248 [Hypsibius exemplaris]|uniref:Glycine N-acyltransferase-like protein n=1 Tax=Hypsibius exemplaris TaxID=2072580 RepID=A0A1W0WE72_HYPEX|nr:hypothetical protein BV898_12248 [Hypsibius exemplaris]
MKLTVEQLPTLVAELKNHFPASLNVYYFARNTVSQQHAWPGLEFHVDTYPNVNACVCRTASSSRTDIPPLFNGYTVYTFSKDPQKLAELIATEGVIDWTESISFGMVNESGDVKVVREKCAQQGGTSAITPGSNYYDHGIIAHFDMKNVPKLEYKLPEGFTLGTLTAKHAEQVTKDKFYGDPQTNIKFFRYFLDAGFPNAALFNADGRPIAYHCQRPENSLGIGFVAEEFRSKGLFKIVVYEVLQKLKANGETEAYSDIAPGNIPSIKTCERLGATFYDQQFEWFEYVPKNGRK